MEVDFDFGSVRSNSESEPKRCSGRPHGSSTSAPIGGSLGRALWTSRLPVFGCGASGGCGGMVWRRMSLMTSLSLRRLEQRLKERRNPAPARGLLWRRGLLLNLGGVALSGHPKKSTSFNGHRGCPGSTQERQMLRSGACQIGRRSLSKPI